MVLPKAANCPKWPLAHSFSRLMDRTSRQCPRMHNSSPVWVGASEPKIADDQHWMHFRIRYKRFFLGCVNSSRGQDAESRNLGKTLLRYAEVLGITDHTKVNQNIKTSIPCNLSITHTHTSTNLHGISIQEQADIATLRAELMCE